MVQSRSRKSLTKCRTFWPSLPLVSLEHLPALLQRRERSAVHERWLARAGGELGVDLLDRAIAQPRLVERRAVEFAEQVDAEILRRGRLGGVPGQLLDLLDGDLVGGRFLAGFEIAVEHAQRVIDDDDVGCPARGAGPVDEAGHEERGEQDEEDAQQQQDHLLDDELAPVALLGLEQKLHRRPADALEAHAVDEVDEDRRADQRTARGHVPGVIEEFHELISTRWSSAC